jgi:hypothetical protein
MLLIQTYIIVGNRCVILVMYVDGLFLTSSERLVAEYKQALNSEFEMKDLGIMHYFLRLEVWQRNDEIFLESRKIYSGDIEEVRYDRVQIHAYIDGNGFEENK